MNARRKRFFDTALKIIYEKGFKATTMRNIAEQLQCDVSNIYNYVKSKQQILENYLFLISAEFHEGIDAVLQVDISARKKLRKAVSMHVKLAIDKPYIVALLADEWRNLKGGKLEQFIAERKSYENKLNSIIEEGIANGEFITPNSQVTTYLVLSAVRWLHAIPPTLKQTVSSSDLEKQVLDFIFLGLDQTKPDQ